MVSARIAFVCLTALIACGCRRPVAGATDSLLADLLTLAEVEGRLAELEMPEEAVTWATVDRIVERARGADGDVVEALNGVLFAEMGFVRETDDNALPTMLLPTVLEERRGSCVGLAQVYLVVAERLGLSFAGVLVPGHLFVRSVIEADSRNIETLRRGEAMPDAWYRERWEVPVGVGAYMRPLAQREVLGVVHFNLGNAYRRQRRLADALVHYAVATELFDDFPEALASQGLVLHLAGDLDGAAAAYEAARRSYPGLPGLEQNVQQLVRERARRATEPGHPGDRPTDLAAPPGPTEGDE